MYGSFSPYSILAFEIPIPLEITGVENKDVFCYVKISTQTIDAEGKVIATNDSAFFKDNPIVTFDFTDQQLNKKVSGFNVIPKIKCDTPVTSSILGFATEQVSMTILKHELITRVYSVVEDGSYLEETYNAKFSIDQVELVDNKEVILGEHFIPSDRILSFIDAGNYDSYQHIVLEGDIKLAYTDYLTVVNTLSVSKDVKYNSSGQINSVNDSDLLTWRNITLTLDDSISDDCNDDQSCEPNVNTCSENQVLNADGSCTLKFKECAEGQYLENNVCRTLPVSGGSVELTGITDDFFIITTCLTTFDTACLAQTQFIPYYLGLLGGIFLIGAVTTRNTPVAFDNFGNRI